MSSVFSLTNVLLKSMLNHRNDFLNVIHYNIQSIVPKIDEIRHTFLNAPVDILCFCETFLGTSIPDSALSISGYNLVRKDRVNSPLNYGGICVYLKDNIKFKILNLPPIITQQLVSDLEFLFVVIFVNNRKLLLGTLYNPPTTNKRSQAKFKKSLKDIECLFGFLSCKFDEIFITGDFNFDILGGSTLSRDYCSVLNSVNLSIHNRVEPTYFYNSVNGSSSSLIDHLVISNRESIKFFNQLSVGLGSHHDLLVFSIDYFVQPTKKYITFRDFSNVDQGNLFYYYNTIPWDSIFHLTSPTEQINSFNSFVNFLFCRSIPLRTVILKDKSPPWFSEEIGEAIGIREEKFGIWKRCGDNPSLLAYKHARNIVVGLIRNAKNAYFKDKLDPSLPPKIFWRNVRNLGLSKCKHLQNISYSANEFNKSFINSSPISNSVDLLDIEASNAFSFRNISEDELYSALRRVKSESEGLDGVSIRFVKKIFPLISKYLVHIFNFCLSSSSYPDQWKLSKIIPIPKIPNPSNLSDFRPISILPSLSKAFELVVKSQIQSHLVRNNLLSVYQSGYKKYYSTNTALLNICDDTRRNMNSNKLTILTLLDFSKAFDSINHYILFNKLISQFNFSISAAKLILNFLIKRFQSVFCNNSLSEFLLVGSGVPQGSILGPLLFSLYINDIQTVISNCSFQIFADDVQIYRSSSLDVNSVNNCIQLVNGDLVSIHDWSFTNGLALNVNKSQCIVIYKKSIDTSNFPPILLNQSSIPFSNTVKDLGLILNKTLTWDEHLSFVSRKIFGTLSCFWKLVAFTDVQFKKRVFMSYLLPHFLYGDIVMFDMLQKNKDTLQKCFNACVRFIYGLRKFDHISPYSNRVLGCSLPTYFEYRVSHFIFKLLKNREPRYLYDKLVFGRSHSSNFRLIPLRNSYNSLNRSMFVKGITLWNSIPLLIKREATIRTFKLKFLAWRSTSNINSDLT